MDPDFQVGNNKQKMLTSGISNLSLQGKNLAMVPQ